MKKKKSRPDGLLFFFFFNQDYSSFNNFLSLSQPSSLAFLFSSDAVSSSPALKNPCPAPS